MELRDVYELWNRFDSSDAAELELSIDGTYIKLRRPGAVPQGRDFCPPHEPFMPGRPLHMPPFAPTQFDAHMASQNAVYDNSYAGGITKGDTQNNPQGTTQETTSSKTKGSSAGTADDVTGTPVKAPLVGTFYKSPSPEEEPFVKVGQTVKKGDVVGIIEAMKLMNEVVAPCDGEVSEILAEDGKLVEFNQVLIVLK